MNPQQRVVLRLGAVMLVLAAVVLTAFAVLIDSGPTKAADLQQVTDPGDIALPAPGLFGGSVIVYGMTARPAPTVADLDCTLRTSSGSELSVAKLSDLDVIGQPSLDRDGTTLAPLFQVSNYPSGARVACAAASGVAPLYVSTPRTFGTLGLLVRAVAAGSALTCVVVAGIGVLITRRPRGASV